MPLQKTHGRTAGPFQLRGEYRPGEYVAFPWEAPKEQPCREDQFLKQNPLKSRPGRQSGRQPKAGIRLFPVEVQ